MDESDLKCRCRTYAVSVKYKLMFVGIKTEEPIYRIIRIRDHSKCKQEPVKDLIVHSKYIYIDIYNAKIQNYALPPSILTSARTIGSKS